MRPILMVLFLILFTITAYSQKQYYDYCVKSRSITKKDIISTFPFNKTTKIELVSFDPDYSEESIPIKDGRIDTEKFKERRVINNEQEERLIDILFNYTFDPKISKDSIIVEVAMCYNPRNAILFINKDDQIIAYIEICFECHRYKNPNRIDMPDHDEFCREKFKMLKDYFQENGILE